MSNVVVMGLPGPAPAAGAKAPPSAGAKGKAGSFGQALEAQGAEPPTPESQGIEPPGQDPGSLDIQAVVQALLGGGTAIEGQTETTGISQLDRLAEVGTAGTDEQDEIPVDGLPFVVLMQKQAPQTVDVVHLTGQAFAKTKVADGLPVTGDVVRPEVLSGDLLATASPVAIAARTAARGEVAPAVLQAVAEMQALKAQATEAATQAPAAAAAPAAAMLPAASMASTTEVVAEVIVMPEPVAEMAVEVTTEPVAPEFDAPAAEMLPEPVAPVTETLEMAAAEMEGAGDVPADAPEVTLPTTTVLQPMVRGADVTATAEAGVSELPTSGTFASDLAGTVRRATLVGDDELRLLLNPPELGHIDVRIIDSPNGLRVVMEAANAEARELIQQQLPALRAALEARDLRIDRIQIERSAEASAEDALGRGSRDGLGNQSGNPGDWNQGNGGGHDDAPWSPVAAIRAEGTPSTGEPPAGSKAQSTEATGARGSAAAGRLDVLA